jgi:hypothetical protein
MMHMTAAQVVRKTPILPGFFVVSPVLIPRFYPINLIIIRFHESKSWVKKCPQLQSLTAAGLLSEGLGHAAGAGGQRHGQGRTERQGAVGRRRPFHRPLKGEDRS